MNIYGLSDRQCRTMIRRKAIEELEICDDGGHRFLEVADTELF